MANKKNDDHLVRGTAQLKALRMQLEKASESPSLKLRLIRARVTGKQKMEQASSAWNDFWDEGNQ